MRPSEQEIFMAVWQFGGSFQAGMTAKEIQEAAGVSPASFYRYLPTVPGLKQCSTRLNPKQYYIDPKDVVSKDNIPVAIQTKIEPSNISSSVEWSAVSSELQEALVDNLTKKTDEKRIAKLMNVLEDTEALVGQKAMAAQLLAIHYLELSRDSD